MKSMTCFDRYLLRALVIATLFVTVVLTAIVFLTQSLRFLELVIESGASASTFWVLTVLALPRFFEIILPLGVMAAVLFVYNRMTLDSELIVARSCGASPLDISKSALTLALIVTLTLYAISLFLAPYTLSQMQKMRQTIKTQFSSVLFREGVFNQVGKGLTVYIRARGSGNDLRGILIHDNRESEKHPSMVLAKRGELVSIDGIQKVIVYDGSRQQFDPEKGILQRLNFERYTIEIPDAGPAQMRWLEPDERNLFQLINPDLSVERNRESLRDFRVEIHKRITNPLLTLSFTLIACAFLLIGPVDRRGQGLRIMVAIILVTVLEGLYLSAYNIARNNDLGFVLMYLCAFGPMIAGGFVLSPYSEDIRRRLLYKCRAQTLPIQEGAPHD